MTVDQALAVQSLGLCKRYADAFAVRDVSLNVPAGAVYGFLGANGAGKTTTIRMILGLARPSGGTVRVFGHDVGACRMAAARLTGALLEARSTYDHLTGAQNLDLTRRMLDLPRGEIDRVLALTDMSRAASRRVAGYSLGMRQRLGLARALLGSPRLLVLDEPMNGLDPEGVRDMRGVIRDLPSRCGATVFLSSHLLSEVEQTATHIGVMRSGRLAAQGALQTLLGRTPARAQIQTDDPARAMQVLSLAGHAPTLIDGAICLRADGGEAQMAAINRRLVEAGLAVSALSLRRPSLEDVYNADLESAA